MLHIRPVSEEQASEEVAGLYADIKHTFGIEIVPLVFQYLAGFEDYFIYVWPKLKQNIQSDFFIQSSDELYQFSLDAIKEIYHPSRPVLSFAQQTSLAQKEHISQTVGKLSDVNAKLLLLTLALREGVKGVSIGRPLLPRVGEEISYEEEIFDQFINNKIMRQNLAEDKEDLEPISKMLAPVFGSNALALTKYPEFFSLIAREMEDMVTKEAYLQKRVGLEHIGLFRALRFQYPLGCTYPEIAQFAGKKPYFGELLYILAETFPTRFPRLVMTTSLMQHILELPVSSQLVVQ